MMTLRNMRENGVRGFAVAAILVAGTVSSANAQSRTITCTGLMIDVGLRPTASLEIKVALATIQCVRAPRARNAN